MCKSLVIEGCSLALSTLLPALAMELRSKSRNARYSSLTDSRALARAAASDPADVAGDSFARYLGEQ